MTILGDLERFAATTLYPWRFAIAAVGIGLVVILVVTGARRGWGSAIRRHPRAGAGVVALVLVLGAPVAWYLGSPLFIRTELVEPAPAAAAEAPQTPLATGRTPSDSPLPPSPPAATTPSSTASTAGSASSAPEAPASTAGPRTLTGEFKGADDFHFGRGRVTLVESPDGAHTLRFDDFSVRNGPDLFVYLSPDPKGSADGAIRLGRLRATDGSFNTPIPAGTDISGTRSVIIWCKEFAVLFAVARLKG